MKIEVIKYFDADVEVVEYINGKGCIYRKTINGVEVPPEMLSPLPSVVIHKSHITVEEVERVYGKNNLSNKI